MTENTQSAKDTEFYSELMRAYFDSTNDAIFVLCDEMKFLTSNKMMEKWLGISEKRLTLHNQRTPITDLLGKDFDVKKFSHFFRRALKGNPVSFEALIKPEKGDERWTEINLKKVDIENGEMVIAVARDISDRKKYLAMIDYTASFDALTGLPNRTSLQRYLQKKKDLVLLTIRLERIKDINESLGQKAGDYVLIEIARRLQRLTDTSVGECVSRFGGVKFALAIPSINLSDARAIAQSIRQMISQPIDVGTGKISLDCGIGIASSSVHCDEEKELIHRAEAAMFIARTEKLGVSIFNPDTILASGDHLMLVSDLRQALTTGEVLPFFQPIVDMNSGSIRVEALARWKHPELGYIAPDKFVCIAEESGLIDQLTSKILQSSIEMCADLINDGQLEGLSVNLSPYCLSNTKLPEEIETYLKRYNINPGALILELTESSVMSSISVTTNTLNALHNIGLGFSIDDFGTGYSSLAKLKQMTLTELKIDKSFIIDIETNENDEAITNASIQMAHGLGLSVVAEGIEDKATWQRLKQMSCDSGQGYWIARPMPVDALHEWLSSR